MDSSGQDFRQDIKRLQKEMSIVIKPLEDITKIKSKDSKFLTDLNKATQDIPPVEYLLERLEQVRAEMHELVRKQLEDMVKSFKHIETQYIKNVMNNGRKIRESALGWRIERLEMQAKPEKSQVRYLYNEEVVVDWQPISNVEDIIQLEHQATSNLDKWAIPAESKPALFFEAYRSAQLMQENTHRDLINISDFYRELRLALIRRTDLKVKPQAKVSKYNEFPRYAFLYNLDLYRKMSSDIPENIRLGFQTGSMKEVNAGKGFVVNGLDPEQDYKLMCYVITAKGL